MTPHDEVQLRADLYKAFTYAIEKVGVGVFKSTSMFASTRMAKEQKQAA